jgi:hypothetical protein
MQFLGVQFRSNGQSWSNAFTDSASYILENCEISDGFITTAFIGGSKGVIDSTQMPGEFLCFGANNLEIADSIAKKVRHIGGGLRYCKAIGVNLKDQGIVQVSMNMTDFTKTSLYRAFELIRIEARRFGISIVGSEVIGLIPLEALVDTAIYYLGIENFSMSQVLEYRIME